MLQSSRTGGQVGTKLQQMSESLPLWFLSNALLHGMLQAPCHPCNHPQPEFCSAKYLHSTGEDTTGQPWYGKVEATTWTCGDNQVKSQNGDSTDSTAAPLQTPPSGFAEIANTLRRSQTSQPLLVEEQTLPQLVGSILVLSQVIQDAWGTMTIDMMACQLNVMGLGPT